MKINEMFRKSIAVSIVAAIIGVMPGAEFYRAAAQVVPTAVQAGGVGAAPVVYVNGVSVGVGMPGRVDASGRMLRGGFGNAKFGARGFNANGVRNTDSLRPSPGFQPTSPLQGEVREEASEVSEGASAISGRVAVTENVVGRIGSLISETPEFSKMSSDGASAAVGSDFYKKVGQSFRGYADQAPVTVVNGAFGSLRKLAAPERNGMSKAQSKRSKSSRRMPESKEDLDGEGSVSRSVTDPDGSLNSRRQDDGPDSVSDEPSRGGDSGGATLFSVAVLATALVLAPVAAMAATGVVAPQMLVVGSIAWFGILMPSAIIHEYTHGIVAYAMGDDTAKKAGRLTLNPFKHVDLMTTVLMPIALSMMGLPPFGLAKRIPVNENNFKRPKLGMFLTSVAGPLTNVVLALAGVGVFHGLLGMATAASPLAVMAVYIGIRTNLLLAVYNLAFMVPGSDGWNAARSLLPAAVREVMDSVESAITRSRVLRYLTLGAAVLFILPQAGSLSGFLANWMLGLSEVPTAGAALHAVSLLPAVVAAGLALSPMSTATKILHMPSKPYAVQAPGAASSPDRVKLMIRIPQPLRWNSDYHVDWVDWNQPDAFEKYQTSVLAMVAQLEKVGISAELLQDYEAMPTASYATLVRAATLSVPADKKAALEAALKQKGFSVEEPRTHTLAVMDPQAANDPAKPQSKTVWLSDVVKITGADKVQEILAKEMANAIDPAKINVPGILKPATLWVMKKLGLLKTPVNPAGSIIDTGNDPAHPMLKGHYTKDAKDGHGHGTWVGSAVVSMDPQQKNLRSYNTFSNGSATTDDILRDLTAAHKDGAEWFTNSWGDSYGDPASLEGQAVIKIAESGKVQFFAAGNEGSGDNTVGGPAIAYYKDPKTGTMMIVSVGATDSDKVTAWFQSRGPWSPYVKENESQFPGYPVRVDIQSVGHKVYGAYPTYMRGADKVDPKLGPQKESSGTSMSTPTMGGAYSLLREFGFEPAAIVKALLENTEKMGKPEAEGGQGFVNVLAAYQALKKAQDGTTQAKFRRFFASAIGAAAMAVVTLTPMSASASMVGGHPATKVGLATVTGAVVGFAAGAAAGARVSRDQSGRDYGALVGLAIMFRLMVMGLFGLGGAVVGAVAGAVIGAANSH